jgi:hypothetical protein
VLKCIDAMPMPLRRKLHIQLDNCVAENKNQGFFYSLGLLIHYGVFDEIELGYVLVVLLYIYILSIEPPPPLLTRPTRPDFCRWDTPTN